MLDKAQQMLDDMMSRNQELARKNAKLKEEVEAGNIMNAGLKLEIAELERLIDNLQNDKENTEKERDDLASRIGFLNDQFEKLRDIEKQKEELEFHLKTLTADYKSADGMFREIHKLESQNRDMYSQLRRKTEAMETIQKQNFELMKRLEQEPLPCGTPGLGLGEK